MSLLPDGLPLEIQIVLQAIDYEFDANEQSNPFFFATYSTIKMDGWDCAEDDLKQNLNEVLEILKKDEYQKGRDAKIQELKKCISEIDTSLGFYSIKFYLEHKFKYLRTVRRLKRSRRPKSYSQFKSDEMGRHGNLGHTKNESREITIPDEMTKKLYSEYLIDFESKNPNPNTKRYRELYERIDPKSLIRHTIAEVYRFFNNELILVYQNTDSFKTVDEEGPRFLRDICKKESRGLTEHYFTPYGYIAVPLGFKGDEARISILKGVQVGGTAGNGTEDCYTLQRGKYVFSGALYQWLS